MKFKTLSRESLVDLYDVKSLTTRQIATRFGITHGTVTSRLIDFDIERRLNFRKNVSEDAARALVFQSWSDDVAYIGGYIWADGSITRKNICEAAVQFRCKRLDRSILEYLKKFLLSKNPIHDYDSRLAGIAFPASALTVSGMLWVGVLKEKFGLIPRKSYTDPPYPNIPDEFFGSFFRGCFDGDGSLIKRTNSAGASYEVSIVGSGKFLDGMSRQAARVFGVKWTPLLKRKNIYKISWYSRRDVELIAAAIYIEPCGFFLKRKRMSPEKNKLDLETYRALDSLLVGGMWLEKAVMP